MKQNRRPFCGISILRIAVLGSGRASWGLWDLDLFSAGMASSSEGWSHQPSSSVGSCACPAQVREGQNKPIDGGVDGNLVPLVRRGETKPSGLEVTLALEDSGELEE